MWPVLAWGLLRHALLLEERDDLGVEEFVWLHDRDGNGNVGLVNLGHSNMYMPYILYIVSYTKTATAVYT